MFNYFKMMRYADPKNDILFDYIRNTFNADFRNELAKIKPNKTTRKNAFSAFKAMQGFIKDSNIDGLFCTASMILYLSSTDGLETAGAKSMDVTNVTKNFTGSIYKKPVDFYGKEDTALARVLGFRPNASTDVDKRYYIEVEEQFYDYALIYTALNCIDDGKRIEAYSVKQTETDSRPSLMLRSNIGFVFVLPFIGGSNPDYNVDFKNYVDFEAGLDKKMIENAIKTA